MFTIRAVTVATGPYSLTRIRMVISTAGPTIKGTPRGTAIMNQTGIAVFHG
jgi:hypothetical protein